MGKEEIVATVMGGAKSTVGLSSSSSVLRSQSHKAADIVGFCVSEVKNGETEINKPQIIASAADIVGFSVSEVKNGETEVKNGETEVKNGETEVKNGKTEAKNGQTEVKNGKTEAKNGQTEVNKSQIITSAADIVGFSVSEVENGETEAKNGKTEVNKPQIITSPMQLIPDVLRTKTVGTMSELDARKAALEMKKMKKALMEGESAAWNVEM